MDCVEREAGLNKACPSESEETEAIGLKGRSEELLIAFKCLSQLG